MDQDIVFNVRRWARAIKNRPIEIMANGCILVDGRTLALFSYRVLYLHTCLNLCNEPVHGEDTSLALECGVVTMCKYL